MNEFEIKISINTDEVAQKIIDDVEGARRAGMINTMATLESVAVQMAPVKTGNLARSRTSDISGDFERGVLRFTAPYAEPVHEGTGIYGPMKRRIIPTTKKALFWPGAKHPVRSIAGMKGRPWLNWTLAQVDPQKVYDEGVANFLKGK